MTILLILITLFTTYKGFNDEVFMQRWMNHPLSVVHRREYYRLLSSGFVHLDWTHLILNLITLYYFGSEIERVLGLLYPAYGKWMYVGFYLSAIIVSDLPIVITKRNDNGYFSLGASGGVVALVMAAVLLSPMNDICLYFILCLPAVVFAVLFLAYTIYSAYFKSADGTNHSSHLWGGIYGLIVFTLLIDDIWPMFWAQVVR